MTGERRYLVAGDRAVLVELPDLHAALGLSARLRDRQSGVERIDGIDEVLPAARTVLVRFRPWRIRRDELIRHLEGVSADPAPPASGRRIEVPVVYGGDDLDEVAALLGMDADEVIRRHTGRDYTVAFAGFAPGFAYLADGDPALDVPRRSTPRTRIPAGSVGLAGRLSGVYPRESPGGWQLIGTTPLAMWDVGRKPPATLQPGDRVRFVALPSREGTTTAAVEGGVRPRVSTSHENDDGGRALDQDGRTGPALVIRRAGPGVLLQDSGRPGLGASGVSPSGVLDRPAYRRANRLVGNRGDEAVLEVALGGLAAAADGPLVVAVTGAEAPVTVRRRSGAVIRIVDQRAVALDDGDEIEIGAPVRGVRSVLAVRGGFAVAPVLGSRSRDTLAGLGPEPVRAGDVLPVGAEAAPRPATAEPEPWPIPDHDAGPRVLPIDLGPRDDWTDAEGLAALTGQDWEVTPRADRVGIRLAGDRPIGRSRDDELPSEGAVPGAIQVPPDGQPVVFLADHPITGGYPVVGVVRHDALPALAQTRPGDRLRFRIAEPPTAHLESPESP